MTDTTTDLPAAPARPARRLADHIHDAMLGMATHVLPEHHDRRDELAEWLETAHDRLVCIAQVGPPKRKRDQRHDLRSLRIDVQLYTDASPAPLVSVRLQDLTTDTAPAQGDPMPDTSTRPTPRHLRDLIDEHLTASAQRILGQVPDHAVQDALATFMETAHDRLLVEADVAGGEHTRTRPGTLRVRVYLRGHADGPNPGVAVELFSVRARDLLQDDGTPVDAKADARTLLLQLGYGVPDDASALDGDRS